MTSRTAFFYVQKNRRIDLLRDYNSVLLYRYTCRPPFTIFEHFFFVFYTDDYRRKLKKIIIIHYSPTGSERKIRFVVFSCCNTLD